jgi:hypothetical protein
MEYNTNTYVTINHSDCETLGLGDNHRTNNDGTVCIIEFAQDVEIPTEVQSVILASYTHEQALELVNGIDWVSELPN